MHVHITFIDERLWWDRRVLQDASAVEQDVRHVVVHACVVECMGTFPVGHDGAGFAMVADCVGQLAKVRLHGSGAWFVRVQVVAFRA